MSDASHFRADKPSPASIDRATSRFTLADTDADPVVSIVTPFFNTSSAFAETATSVFRQTFKQWEWIIVNDGTTRPESLRMLDSYRAIDPRVTVIDRESNGGPGSARNSGMQHAAGRYIMQLDSDDLLEPTAIEKLFWFLETHPEYAFAKGYTVGFGTESYVWVNGFHMGDAFLEQNHADVLAMIRRDVVLDIGGYDETNRDGLEDWEFWLSCADAGYWGGTVHEPLGWYRRRASHGETWSNWDDGPKEHEFRTKMQRKYPNLWRGGFPAPSENEAGFELSLGDVNRLMSSVPSMLLIVPWLQIGGADRVNLQILQGVIDAGWDATVVTTLPSPNPWEERFTALTPDVFVMDRFLEVAHRLSFVDYLVKSRNPDVVVVSNSWLGYDILPFLRARNPAQPIVDLTHAEEDWNDGGYPRLSNEYSKYLDLRITGSDHVRDWMIQRGGDDNIRVWYTGIDASRFGFGVADRTTTRSTLKVSPETFVLLFVGRLSSEKQPEVVLRIVDHLSQQGLDVHAVIVGDGPNIDPLRAEIDARSISDRITLERHAADSRIAALMNAADAFVLPSLREGIAVTVYEAMASGLPVLATDVGGQSELITDDTGVVIDGPDRYDVVLRFSAAVADLVAQPQRAREMGEAGRKRVTEHFRSTAATKRFIALLKEAIDARSSIDIVVEPVSREALAEVIAHHRDLEVQQRHTLNQWRVAASLADSTDTSDGDRSVSQGRPDDGRRVYGVLARVLGYPYRGLKKRNPALAIAMRDRVRSIVRAKR